MTHIEPARVPAHFYDWPRFFWIAGGEYLPGPSAFELWLRKEEMLSRLDELRPSTLQVITNEVRP